MELMRLVITGPVSAGKSTFIHSVSEIDVVDTDAIATDETKEIKAKTTVAMDFGKLRFSPEFAMHLYGTPGQERFDFMWDLLIRKAHAYILLVAANQPQEFRSARRIMTFMNQRVQIPMMIGITHTDCDKAWGTDNIAIALGFSASNSPPLQVVNPLDTSSVAQTLLTLVQKFDTAATTNS
ncbi:GTPase [Euhalothece natronophila Z-M001]|uniref:GTPase n=1 Tax=Euhalothece natronophila Z-M001 TaxID=522448 RepID=A0A5B8NLP1_9CHRO|nr:ATP/GTP-binding protein [Euhalothece natronophila]QDZ39190.1 GTPase [Euhalothece natronophila Z-M001]